MSIILLKTVTAVWINEPAAKMDSSGTDRVHNNPGRRLEKKCYENGIEDIPCGDWKCKK
jgi:hypothetical protein